MKKPPTGKLLIIGGAEDKHDTCQILREFVRKAGGIKARLVVLTVASSLPYEVGEDYIRVFERLGAADVRIVHTDTREDTERESVRENVQQATGIFFAGGSQQRIIDIIKDTELDRQLHQRCSEGVIIAGTSAGAAIMPDRMIEAGDSDTNPRPETVEMGPGLGFLPGIVVDQHFTQRGRLGRLLTALVMQPSALGIGIDENTAILVEGSEFEVIGTGAVTVIDETDSSYNNLDQLLHDEDLAIFGVKLHILPNGYRFNLTTRKPIRPEA
ncbi:MAG: cyanophycinase [Leptolyngbya sp. SIO4C1]|nr:cyanophycinase [Leptolyngbya sp. SIO4C1]